MITLERGSCTKIMTSTGGCSYSFVYSNDGLATLEGGSCTKKWPVAEAVVTFLCTVDDGCVWHPKHVKWTCRIINRLRRVVSRWTIINKLVVILWVLHKPTIHSWSRIFEKFEAFYKPWMVVLSSVFYKQTVNLQKK